MSVMVPLLINVGAVISPVGGTLSTIKLTEFSPLPFVMLSLAATVISPDW